MLKKTIYAIKRNYSKVIDSIIGIEGKLDYAIHQYDIQIVKLGDARTACDKAGLAEKVTGLEEKIEKVYATKQQLISKKTELVAKVKQLEAEKHAAILCAGISEESPDFVIGDVEQYIKKLEAEIRTYDFIGGLK